VLRFWPDPRTIDLYTFAPKFERDTALSRPARAVQQRWQRLMTRHGDSQKLIDLSVLPSGERDEIAMPDIASRVTIESGELDLEALGEADISPYFQHTSILQAHRADAEGLREDIVSAKVYHGQRERVSVLLKHGDAYAWPVYEPASEALQTLSPVELLGLIRATEETPTALVAPEHVEACASACIQAWCTQDRVAPSAVERVCTLYLKPESAGDTVRDWVGHAESPA
jgi:hypothetical protein